MLKRAVLLGALALCACGGGGGGGGGLKLTFPGGPLELSYRAWDMPGEDATLLVHVDARVTGSTNATNIYVFIADANANFVEGQIGVGYVGLDTYRASLDLRGDLAMGTHSGRLEVQICGDPGCQQLLASSALPYSIEIQQNPTLRIASTTPPLVGKALAAAAGDPKVVGFRLPTLALQSANLTVQDRSPLYVRAADADGRIDIRPWTNGGDYAYFATIPSNNTLPLDFEMADGLPAGEYEGTLTFQFCRDPGCNDVFSGESTLPYQLSVAASNATALTPVEGAPDWQGQHGNPGRTAYVPMTVDLAAFAPRWISHVAQTASRNYSTDVVTAAGHVYVTRQGESSASTDLYALAEDSGAIAWQKNFTGGTISPLLAANGRVYLQTAATGQNAVLRAHAVADGAESFAKTTDSESASAAPLAVGANLIVQDVVDVSGYSWRFRQYDGATGDPAGTPSCLAAAEAAAYAAPGGGVGVMTRPAISGSRAFIQMSTGLEVVDFGEAQSCTHHATGDVWHYATAGAVSSSDRHVYTASHCSSDSLRMYNPASSGGWSRDMGNCNAHNAAIRSGVVYAMGTDGLQAIDEATGTLLWSLNLFQSFGVNGGHVLVTDNMVFVISGRVFAIDLATRKVVWTLSPLALSDGSWALSSSGVLYLVDRPGGLSTAWSLVAVNLR